MFLEDGVEGTASDVVGFKMTAISKGYYVDNYMKYFAGDVLYGSHLPHQNFGSYLRALIIERVVTKFHSVYGSRSHIVNFGCGFDTLFWRLRDKKVVFDFWYEFDKQRVIDKKMKIINEREEFHPLDKYSLEVLDLEEPNSIDILKTKIDISIPTLFIDEFSLIYVSEQSVRNLFTFIGSNNKDFGLVSYTMTNLDDDFGELILEGFHDMNVPLLSTSLTKTPKDAVEMLLSLGFECADANEAISVAKKQMTIQDRQRVSRLDYFDDPREVDYILKHYLFLAGGSTEFCNNIFH